MKTFRGQPDHDHWRKPFSATEKANAWAGFGIVLLAMGMSEWFNPRQPPFTGRWSWVFRSLHDSFGAHGMAYGWFVGGAFFLFAAIATRMKMRRENARHVTE